MTKEELISYWIEGSEKNFVTMEHMLESKEYHWALYVGHLVIEKLLKAYLFGSYTKGRFHEDSDIDLAIILKNLKDDFEMQVKLMILRRGFDLSIEPHPFDEKDFDSTNPFAYEIMKTSIKIL